MSLQLHELLRHDGVEVVGLESEQLACDVVAARAVDAVIVDVDAGVPQALLAMARSTRMPLVALTSDEVRAAALIQRDALRHVIVAEPRGDGLMLDARDAIATVDKLIRGEVFGLSPYLHGQPLTYCVSDMPGAHHLAIALRDDLTARGLPAPRAARLSLLAHRFSCGALDADHGETVSDRNPLVISVATDLGTAAVSMRFGGLERPRLLALARAARGDMWAAGSAGLDLPPVLEWCRSVIINANPGRETEIIGLLPAADSPPQRASLHVSISYGDARDRRVPLDSIDLSDSMRLQLQAAAVRGGWAVAEALGHEQTDRVAVSDLHRAVSALQAASDGSAALRTALGFLAELFRGAIVFEVAGETVALWGAAGAIAHTDRLQQFAVRVDEASTLAFLAREAALVQGRSGRSPVDRDLADIVADTGEVFGVSLSIVVTGRVRYIIYGCEPYGARASAARALETVGDELSRALNRFENRRSA